MNPCTNLLKLIRDKLFITGRLTFHCLQGLWCAVQAVEAGEGAPPARARGEHPRRVRPVRQMVQT